ncbi:MAG TPA: YegS/Rv2252/BmrU family lipid kinase [Candidatus Acidoferrum sp.]|nr:YegS/Rv2252/BmrU family lipid kinase [Candidatus Acidoferrum sp.]
MPREVVVVINRRSRRSQSELERLQKAFAAHRLHVVELHVAADDDECRRSLKHAVKAGAPEVVVGGGDGTMTHAVDVLANRETVLGVLPLGTGNSFAQSLGIDPHDLEAAVATIARRHVAQVDLGVVNGTHFANFATIGLSSQIAGATQRSWKNMFGTVAYALAGIGPLLTHRPFRAKIRWPGGRLTLETQDIIVANGRYFGKTALGPDATIDEGLLTLFTSADRSALDAVRTYLALGRGTQLSLPGAHLITARSFSIVVRKRQRIRIDGSAFARTPAQFRVAPGALRVFVPESGVAHG